MTRLNGLRLSAALRLALPLLMALTLYGGGSASAQPSDSTSFLYVADPETGTGAGEDPLGELRVAALAAPGVTPSFVIAGGNVTAHGSAAEYAGLQRDVAALQSAGTPLYAVPGSRDVEWCPNGKESFQHAFGKLYQSFDRAGVHFILLDTTVFLEPLGHVDKAEMDWLAKDLGKLKPETPILVFCYHKLGEESPNARPDNGTGRRPIAHMYDAIDYGPGGRSLDNEFDLIDALRSRNVLAIFCGEPHADRVWKTNGITTISAKSLKAGSKYLVQVDPALVRIDRAAAHGALVHVATIAVPRRSHASVLKAGWDDPDIPYLERRRPAATLEPRAVADDPDEEKASYRIDDGAWKPLTKDARDVWRDTFSTRGIPVGVHSADIDVLSSSGITHSEELIFELERSTREPNRKWALNLDGPIQASPVLQGNLLIVPCLDGKVYALDAASGKHRWAFSSKSPFVASAGEAAADSGPTQPEPGRSRKHRRASGQTTLFAGCTDHYLYALDAANGHLLWKFDAGSPIFAQPAVAEGVVCFGAGDKVYGLDAAGGQLRWSQPARGWFQGAAATDGSAFYLAGSDGAVYALKASTGAPVWNVSVYDSQMPGVTRFLHGVHLGVSLDRYPCPVPDLEPSAVAVVAAPAVMDGRVFVCTTDGDLVALDSASGKSIWTVREDFDHLAMSSPVARDGTIYIASTGEHGDVYAFDARTGEQRWCQGTGRSIYNSSPALAPDGKSLAIMSVRGRVSVLDTATGKLLWTYELGPGNIFSSPAYDGSVVYTTTMANDVQALNGPGVEHMPSEPVAKPPKR
jgi:outer membrane protein assembly factor BamB